MFFARALIAAFLLFVAQAVPASAADAAKAEATDVEAIATAMDLARDSGQELVIVPARTGLPMHGLKLPSFSGLPAPLCYLCDQPATTSPESEAGEAEQKEEAAQ